MTKRLIFRWAFLLLFTAGMLSRFLFLNEERKATYLENATEILGTKEAAIQQLELAQVESIVNVTFISLMAALFFWLVIKPLARKDKWWLTLFLTFGVAAILGFFLAHIDNAINPYYYITTQNAFNDIRSMKTINSLALFKFGFLSCAFVIASSVYALEQIIFNKDSVVRRFPIFFWLGIHVLSFGLISVIFIGQFLKAISEFSSVLIFLEVIALLLTCVSVFFIDAFYDGKGFSSTNFFSKSAKVLMSSFGITAALCIWLFTDIALIPFLDFFYGRFIAAVAVTVLIMCLLTYAVYRLNLGRVHSTFLLQADLQKRSSELNFLKSQINPHFLFNSLNTVYGLALEEGSKMTAMAIQKLSEMMRFMLQENTAEKIAISREIDYLNNYIDLQRLRLQGVEVGLDIDLPEASQGEIAPMLLIPFVENAFKHGVSLKNPSSIMIKVECDPGQLSMKVKNTRHPKPLDEHQIGGVGIENVRQRLEILYPEKHELRLNEGQGSYLVQLKLDLI